MATRASIIFKDVEGNFLANVYKHYDGYPEYLGEELLKLTSGKIVNGLTMKPDGVHHVLGEMFNGMGCLVASVIAKLKDQPGDVYLCPEVDYGNCGEDYLYEVIENNEGTGAVVFIKNMDGEWDFLESVLIRSSFDSILDSYHNR